MFVNKLFTFLDILLSFVKEYRCLENIIHQIDIKILVGFCLNTGKLFFLEVSFLRPTERALILLKTVLGIFKIAFRLRDRHVFMWQSVEILHNFSTLTLKKIFWKTKTFFKILEYRLVESTKLNTYYFHKKLSYQKPMLRQMEWLVQNRYHKERSFANNYFISLKFLFQFKNLL